MAHQFFHPERIQGLNTKEIRHGAYVQYWMQQSQRAEENHALEVAIQQANALHQPLLVVFGLMDDYPEANLRHYRFLLEGLQETQKTLADRDIKLVVQYGHPVKVVLETAKEASLVVCDRGYLRHQRAWRKDVAEHAACQVIQVETDVVVPVEVVSDKAEYAARTIRPKIHRYLDDYLIDIPSIPLDRSSLSLPVEGISLDDLDDVLQTLKLDLRISPVNQYFHGGTTQAKVRFQEFLDEKLEHYDANSNQPQTDDVSYMSPYLHFGQISPLYLARKVKANNVVSQDAKHAFLEQLIVRRELAMNFVYYTEDYDSFTCLPGWAANTLDAHRQDSRPFLYTQKQLEQAKTHDIYWNAAMNEMKYTGFMHNYMRMYWGKKILEWSDTPEQAFTTTLSLNNRYFLDGRDPNSYTGVAWLYGVHDRAWGERQIFGKIRYMAASGLKGKCDIQAYIKKIDRMRARKVC